MGTQQLWSLVILTVLGAATLLPAADPATKKYTIEDVRKAWQARQDRVHAGRFRWKVVRTTGKGSQDWMVTGPEARRLEDTRKRKGIPPPRPGKQVVPPRDMTHTIEYAASFDGVKHRYSYRGNHAINPLTRETDLPTYYVSMFDGALVTMGDPEGGVVAPYPCVKIKPATRADDAGTPQMRPILMTFRPLIPQLRTYDLDRLVLTGRAIVDEGRHCLELEQRWSSTSVTRLWVDPARDFLIVRYIKVTGRTTTQSIRVRFRSDPAAGWVPEAWDVTLLNPNGSFRESSRATLTEYEINPRLPPSEFEYPFSYGTLIRDERTMTTFIVKENGRRRQLAHEENFLPYEQVLHAEEPGIALSSAGGPAASWPWRIWALSGLVLCLGGVLLWRWRVSRRASVN